MAIIKMVNNGKEITFRVFSDGTYIVGTNTTLCMDFADAYIQLRDAGFIEVK